MPKPTPPSLRSESDDFRCALDIPSGRSFFVGKGLALFLRGWAFHPASVVRKLYVVDGKTQKEIRNHSWVRPDVLSIMHPTHDRNGNSLFSEFNVILPIDEIFVPQRRELLLRAELHSGKIVERQLATFALLPGRKRRALSPKWRGAGPKVAICMAAYRPPPELFQRQIQSIIAQDHENWLCIITDDSVDPTIRKDILKIVGKDSRFIYRGNRERKGFYLNFEECLSYVPDDAEFIALADQDDFWYADKLSKLIAALADGRKLAFSDCRIVSDGRVLSETYWDKRRNHYDDFLSLFIANTITGAASLFTRDVLEYALPFPQDISNTYHDQWIGLTAHILGGLSYVDAALYDYNQHGANVIGQTGRPLGGSRAILAQLLRHSRSSRGLLDGGRRILEATWRDFSVALQKSVFAETLRLRGQSADEEDANVIDRMARYGESLSEAIRLKMSAVLQRRSTLNVEGFLFSAALGVRARNLYYRLRKRSLLATVRSVNSAARTAPRVLVEAQPHDTGEAAGKWMFDNISPLRLRISNLQPKRLNLLLATIDFKYVFGGYIAMFRLALRLRREGFAVRIILTEPTDLDLKLWRKQIKGYPGITELFDEVEVISRHDGRKNILVSPHDRFIATNCWGAHIAHNASNVLGQERFLFMVQEYEPYFLPMNSVSALFQQSYRFPQFDLFSTYQLKDFFRQNRIAVFGGPGSEQNHAVFRNAIQKFNPSLQDMRDRQRRILFYARPEAHAARNLFELGLRALVELAKSPEFDRDNWRIFGMGSIGGVAKVPLTSDVDLELMPKTDLRTYAEFLPQHDVGLSLMLTPHPSLVPLEMAAAGMWAVTNTFANKTAASLAGISTNILPVEPTLEGVIEGLKDAISRTDQFEQRLRGARINWPTDWEDAFSKDAMRKIVGFLS